MKITVKVPGSCGELIQGEFNAEPFLITCPIDLFTTVTISDEFNGRINLGVKSQKMLEMTLKYLGRDNFNFGIELKSDLPHGKGMASSSADIAAVAKAVALACGVELTAEEILKLAVSIEPTDGIFFNGIVAMNPVNGKILCRFNSPTNYKIAIFDFGGKIDTLNFKRQTNFYISELPANLNLEMTTASALANQKILFKPQLEEIINFSKLLGAITVNVAHTGTVIGVFFDKSKN